MIAQAQQAANEKSTPLSCPRWFFGLGAIFLLLRPIAGLTGFLPVPIPPEWETLCMTMLVCLLACHSWDMSFGLSLAIWTLATIVLSSFYPISIAWRWLILLGAVELISPSVVPQAWCLFWLILPAFSTSLWGEPLPGLLSFAFLSGCLFAAYRTTLTRWQEQARPYRLVEILVGAAIGILTISFAQSAPALDKAHLPTIVFDEEHGSTESALGEEQLPNGHQEMVFHLRRMGFPVLLKETTAVSDLPANSIFITVLPSLPYSKKELETLSAFVKQGGKLLAILDHTDMDGASSRLSPLLLEFGAVPAFDTIAWPTHRLPATGLTKALGNILCFHGTGGAVIKPAFWSPYPFSSDGPHPLSWIEGAAQAMEGVPNLPLNQQMSAPERPYSCTGPIWTGAWGQYGKGRWILFTDSSWFQNGQFALNMEFMSAAFSLLVNGAPARSFPLWLVSWLITLSGLKLIYRRVGKPLLPVGIIMGTLLGVSPSPFAAPAVSETLPQACFILDSGAPSSFTSLRPGTFKNNLDTMAEYFFRSGYELHFLQTNRNVNENHDVYILPAMDSLPPRLIREHLRDRVAGGAKLILLGNHNLSGSREVFAEFGFSLEVYPPKVFQYELNNFGLSSRAKSPPFRLTPASHDLLGTWTEELFSDVPVPVYGGEPLFLRSDGEPVISCRREKKGWVIAVGDEAFFQNQSLEVRGQLDDPKKKEFIEYFGKQLQKMASHNE